MSYVVQFSEGVRVKAAGFVGQGRVARVPGQKDLWEVKGWGGTYRVRTNPQFDGPEQELRWFVCTCPYSDHASPTLVDCSHSLAVIVMAEAAHRGRVARTADCRMAVVVP